MKRVFSALVVELFILCLFWNAVYQRLDVIEEKVDQLVMYEDTMYPEYLINPVLEAIVDNKDRLQLYMTSRYEKVAELDWEHPDDIDPQKAMWKFRWLSKDWYLIAIFDVQTGELTALYSYEEK